mmetsp:Transcript_12742/g.20602  ORF Transcript_12742/g.20602 Transcript_12742/m.20602 type:complete len:353 (-) Transcript_12742:4776-5834(-)
MDQGKVVEVGASASGGSRVKEDEPLLARGQDEDDRAYIAAASYVQIPTADVVAPGVETMGRLSELDAISIRQGTNMVQALVQSITGIPYEEANNYRIGTLPSHARVGTSPNDPARWKPSKYELLEQPEVSFGEEESDPFVRCCLTCFGCKQARGLKVHYPIGDEHWVQDKPFAIGGGLCCPVTSTVFKQGQNVVGPRKLAGRVQEDCIFGENYFKRCFQRCCLGTAYSKVETVNPETGFLEPKYKFVVNILCCGRVNNCCGATCCRNDAVFDITDMDDNVVAHVQKTYASQENCGALCRMFFGFSNYTLSFPEGASEEDRATLMAAVVQEDYHLFEFPNPIKVWCFHGQKSN